MAQARLSTLATVPIGREKAMKSDGKKFISCFAEHKGRNMFPHEIKFLDEEQNRSLLDDFEGERTGFCQVGSQKWLLPASYAHHAEGYYTMPLRESDIWVITFPRSGTTLCQELVWLINNNFDYEQSSRVPLESRVPFYEFGVLHHEEFHREIINLNDNDTEVIKQLASWREPGYIWGPQMSSPRHFKTHLPFSLLPPGLEEKCKAIYIARNPKDVAESYYHHNRFLKVHGYNGDFKKYWDYFERDLLVYCPFWEHLEEGWERRNHRNVLFIFYENLVKDMRNEIEKIAAFLGKSISDEEVEKLLDHLQIDNFRKSVQVHKEIPMKGIVNTSEQGFIRKGKVGEHGEFTPELTEIANNWVEENLSNTDIRFPL